MMKSSLQARPDSIEYQMVSKGALKVSNQQIENCSSSSVTSQREDALIELVKKIVAEQLGPALEKRVTKMQGIVQASVTLAVRGEVRRDHSENRMRLQLAETKSIEAAQKATEAAEQSARAEQQASKAVDQNVTILARQNDMQELSLQINSALQGLISRVEKRDGIAQGKAKAQQAYAEQEEKKHHETERRKERWVTTGRWVGGALLSAGFGKYLYNLIMEHIK